MTVLRTRLDPPALEAEFRTDGLAWDKRVTSGLALVAIVFLAVTTPDVIAVIGTSARLPLVWAVRIFDLAAAVGALFLIRRVAEPRTYDVIATSWIGAWFVALIAENMLLPAAWIYFVWWDVLLVFVMYSAVPLPLAWQGLLGAVISIGDLLVLWKLKSPGPLFSIIDVTLAFSCANVVGAFVSHERHGWRRRTFLALRSEVAARAETQAALLEVKTLQGIIPICAYCHHVRTEVGAWEQLDRYVRARTEARFSHGICPNCAAVHHPGLDEQELEIVPDPATTAGDSRER